MLKYINADRLAGPRAVVPTVQHGIQFSTSGASGRHQTQCAAHAD